MVGGTVTTTVAGSRGDSKSESLPKTAITTGVSSVVGAVSLLATGASLTGLTVIVKVWLSQIPGNGKPESQTSIVIISVPVKSGFGV